MNGRLQHFPIALFSAVMGLSGLALALDQAQRVLGLTVPAGRLVAALAAIAFVVIAAFYGAKLVTFRAAVMADLNHPVRMSFAATFSVSLILLGTLSLGPLPRVSAALWSAGTLIHLVLTLYVLTAWVYQPRFEIQHISPVWFIPAVGNILVPIAGVHHAGNELNWFFFSIGFLFWVVLFVIVMYRMIFHHPLPDRLLPTLFILIAPPAAGFLSYVALTGSIDAFARVLYYGALFLTIWLLTQARRFIKLPFFLSWWAYSFPLAAVTVATMSMYHVTGDTILYLLSYALLFVLLIVVTWLVVRTAFAIRQDEICVEERA